MDLGILIQFIGPWIYYEDITITNAAQQQIIHGQIENLDTG